MCGRLNVSDNEGVIAIMEMMGMPLSHARTIESRYNVAPTSNVPIATEPSARMVQGQTRWGIKYSGSSRIYPNAKIETLTGKRDGLTNRCIIFANGFYEWRRSDKQAFYCGCDYEANMTDQVTAASFC